MSGDLFDLSDARLYIVAVTILAAAVWLIGAAVWGHLNPTKENER